VRNKRRVQQTDKTNIYYKPAAGWARTNKPKAKPKNPLGF
jgi:hypothetical protein